MPGHRELSVDDTEVDALPLWQRSDLGTPGKQDLCRLHSLTSKNRMRSRFDDPGLLPRDLGDRTAQQMSVIKIDWSDHRNICIGNIGRIPGAAQADLDDCDIDRRIGKCGVGHCRDDLEEGQRHAINLAFVNHCNIRLDLAPHLVEAFIADRLPVDGDPLGHAQYVWTGESTGTKAIGSQQRFDHGRGTALAVGAGQVDDRVSPLWIAKQLGQRPDPAEARCWAMFRPAAGERGDDLCVRLFGRHDAQSLGRRWRSRLGRRGEAH